jgi:hypothetical protein
LEDAKATMASLDTLMSANKSVIASLQKDLAAKCPLALLALTMVEPHSARQGMENRLGTTLATLRKTVAELRTKQMGERVAEALPLVDMRVTGSAGLQLPRYGPQGPELTMIEAAAKRAERDPAWTPMLHEATWDTLVAATPTGTFAWVVANHYRDGLITRRIAAETERRESKGSWRIVAAVAATLSLAALFAPGFGTLGLIAAGILTQAGAGIGLAVAVHDVLDIADQVTAAGGTVTARLSGSTALAVDTLANLGAVARFRQEAMGETIAQITSQLILQSFATRLPVLKQVALAYGYQQDLQTILEPLHGRPTAP